MNDCNYYYYCPYCGYSQFTRDYGRTMTCAGCSQLMTPSKSQHTCDYYKKKSYEKYNVSYYGLDRILFEEEIKTNPLFDEEKYLYRMDEHDRAVERAFNNKANSNQPKCPTCGSTNISKISTASKVVGAAAFGFFSKTAKSQFKCNSCGYKW